MFFSDSSYIVMAIWTYFKDEFGVSLYSVSDFCYFKTDSNGSFQWSTSIDFLNSFEERQSIYEYNEIVYIAIITSKYYYCLQTIDKSTGVVNNSQCAYVYKPTQNSIYRLITICYASDQYVYALFFPVPSTYLWRKDTGNLNFLVLPSPPKIKIIVLSHWKREFKDSHKYL